MSMLGYVVLELVDVEQAAVEVGHLTEERVEVRRALRGLLAEPFVEQAQQEVAVEAQELVLALPLLDHLEAVPQVVRVSPSRKPFFWMK